MSNRYEPGPTGEYGADGIARQGMDERYATALWRDNPAAFWLHPDGPLADSEPGEWFVPEPPPVPLHAMQYLNAGYLNGLQNVYGGLHPLPTGANVIGALLGLR